MQMAGIIQAFGATLLMLGVLVPNHSRPWYNAWNDGVSIAGILLLALSILVAKKRLNAGRWDVAFILLVVASAGIQFFSGQLLFSGDLLLVVLYAVVFLLAIIGGRSLDRKDINGVFVFVAAGAFISTLIGIAQFLGSDYGYSAWIELRSADSRVFGNLLQANNYATVAFIGCVLLYYFFFSGLIKTPIFLALTLVLIAGGAAGQSRTYLIEQAILQILSIYLAFKHKKSLVNPLTFLAVMTVLIIGWLLPMLADGLQLGSRHLAESEGYGGWRNLGGRLPIWQAALDAVWRSPWFGYGWQQGGVAQLLVSPEHPMAGNGSLPEHAHNLFIDFMVWTGLPLGIFLSAMAVYLFYKLYRLASDPPARVLWAGCAGVMAHAMLEFPLDYAYILVPFGLMLGAIHAFIKSENFASFVLPKQLSWAILAGLAATLSFLAIDVLNLESAFRHVAFVQGRQAAQELKTSRKIYVADNVASYIVMSHEPVRKNMPPEILGQMQKTVVRYPFSTFLFRSAMAAGLNKQPEKADQYLRAICFIYGPKKCALVQEGWKEVLSQEAALEPKTVNWPQLPQVGNQPEATIAE